VKLAGTCIVIHSPCQKKIHTRRFRLSLKHTLSRRIDGIPIPASLFIYVGGPCPGRPHRIRQPQTEHQMKVSLVALVIGCAVAGSALAALESPPSLPPQSGVMESPPSLPPQAAVMESPPSLPPQSTVMESPPSLPPQGAVMESPPSLPPQQL
jgi:hypothetical protein